MTAAIRRLASLLGVAALMAIVLGVMAGILGMHVMTADHSAHTSHVVLQATDSSPAADMHGSAHRGHATPPSLATETCFGSCPEMQDAGPMCVLLANTASLTVFPADGPAAVEPGHAAGVSPAAGYSYIPASPTPCELSISRT
ncbi:hypothetical protein QF038_000714 [Pseudarthrobacter sp. W1I19]|uniref:DUF6153 family protein n=1 Tax=Pseudarthrobacter sp. W1I19 TaxID=3042288 RepID=UPI002781E541|nr:DUF6153 family protein [Pseudarthrobacter sp. W1I19]MDQ0922206.1 hypothetical protein [Pseudarthrobacter sp. W1I19]